MLEMAISLIDAIRSGDLECAKRILQQRTYTNIDRQTQRKDGTALFWACCRGYIELVHLLILHGADVHKTTSWGATALHASADNGHVDILRLLLRFGASVDVQTQQGDTPCHLASYRGHSKCVQCLAEHGADVRIINKKHHTALDDALNRGHYEVYQYLSAVQDIVRKCETQSSAPHPGCTSHTLDSTPPLKDAHAPSGDISPAQKSVTCASHKPLNDMASEYGCHISEENFVGILHTTHNSSLLSDSLLSLDCSSSSFGSTNDLSRQTSLCSEPQLSYRNIP